MIETPAVLIVGAGPAGLAAASALCRAGYRPVLVIERDEAAGGLPRFCRHPGFGWAYSRRLDTGPAFAARMLREAEAAGATIMTATTALQIEPGPRVHVVGPNLGYRVLAPRAVVLATGIRETARGPRLIPGSRPETGLLTTGALQQLLSRGLPLPWRRLVIAGSEHVSFSAIVTARHAGLRTVAMVEADERIGSYALAGLFARAAGIAIHTRSRIVDIRGERSVEAVCVETGHGREVIACDALLFSAQWRPESALCATGGMAVDPGSGGPVIDNLLRTSLDGVFAAGNLLRGVESSGMAGLEGRLAGDSVAAFLSGRLSGRQGTVDLRPSQELEFFVPQRLATDTANGLPGGLSRAYFRVRRDSNAALAVVRSDGAEVRLPTGRLRKLRGNDVAMAAIRRFAAGEKSHMSVRLV